MNIRANVISVKCKYGQTIIFE